MAPPIFHVMFVNSLLPLASGVLLGIRIAPLIRMTMSERTKRLGQWSVIALLFAFIGVGLTTGAININPQSLGLPQLQARLIGMTVGASAMIFLLVVGWIMLREARVVESE